MEEALPQTTNPSPVTGRSPGAIKAMLAERLGMNIPEGLDDRKSVIWCVEQNSLPQVKIGPFLGFEQSWFSHRAKTQKEFSYDEAFGIAEAILQHRLFLLCGIVDRSVWNKKPLNEIVETLCDVLIVNAGVDEASALQFRGKTEREIDATFISDFARWSMPEMKKGVLQGWLAEKSKQPRSFRVILSTILGRRLKIPEGLRGRQAVAHCLKESGLPLRGAATLAGLTAEDFGSYLEGKENMWLSPASVCFLAHGIREWIEHPGTNVTLAQAICGASQNGPSVDEEEEPDSLIGKSYVPPISARQLGINPAVFSYACEAIKRGFYPRPSGETEAALFQNICAVILRWDMENVRLHRSGKELISPGSRSKTPGRSI